MMTVMIQLKSVSVIYQLRLCLQSQNLSTKMVIRQGVSVNDRRPNPSRGESWGIHIKALNFQGSIQANLQPQFGQNPKYILMQTLFDLPKYIPGHSYIMNLI